MNARTTILTWLNNWVRSLNPKYDLTRIKTLNIGKQINEHVKESEIKKFQNLITELITNTSDDSKIIVKTLLDNQLKQIINCVDQFSLTYNTNTLLLRITAEVAKSLYQLGLVVGIQPMQGPTGLIYKIIVKDVLPEQNATTQRRIIIEIVSCAVLAVSRKLQTTISNELMQDTLMLHNVDVGKEIIQQIATEIVSEITNEVMYDLIDLAMHNYKKIHRRSDDTHSLHAKHVIEAIHHASNQIAHNTKRGRGNIIICSPDSLVTLQDYLLNTTLTFKPQQTAYSWDFGYVGNIVNITDTLEENIIYKVFTSTQLEVQNVDRYLIGYQGASTADSGYYFCPYLITTNIVIGGSDCIPRANFVLRGGKHTDVELNGYQNAQNYYKIIDADSFKIDYNNNK